MPDFAHRRKMMVDTQVRPSDVTKFPIIAAMLDVPRERFVPAALAEAAYVGENLPLAPGRCLLEPRTLAKMLDALDLGPGDLVLDVAPGTGYSSAVMARIAEAVVAVEPDADLAAEAEAALAAVGAGNVVVERGPAAGGAPAHGPYDALIVQGGVEVLPEALVAQLKEGGRAVVLFVEGPVGTVRLGVRTQGALRWRDAFNALAPVLPGFVRARAFAL
jgi:protein-L-isoaspartate(D-aspartate) O-methyltransferase